MNVYQNVKCQTAVVDLHNQIPEYVHLHYLCDTCLCTLQSTVVKQVGIKCMHCATVVSVCIVPQLNA